MNVLFIGDALNDSCLNSVSINGEEYAEFFVTPLGYTIICGSSPSHSYHYWDPSGGTNISGYIAEAYGQLAVIGGYSYFPTIVSDCELGHAGSVSGYAIAAGASDYRSVFSVQIMQNARTAYVRYDNRECSVLPYENICAVLPTEHREIKVLNLDSYY